jgi:hypothetical protein
MPSVYRFGRRRQVSGADALLEFRASRKLQATITSCFHFPTATVK